MQNKSSESSQPLELFFYLTHIPAQFSSVFIEVVEVEWDQVATTASLLQAPTFSNLPQGAKLRSDFSQFVKPGTDKILGKTEKAPVENGRVRFEDTVTIPYVFQKKQILKMKVMDAATGQLIESSNLSVGTLIASKSKDERVSFLKYPEMKLKVIYEGMKSKLVMEETNLRVRYPNSINRQFNS